MKPCGWVFCALGAAAIFALSTLGSIGEAVKSPPGTPWLKLEQGGGAPPPQDLPYEEPVLTVTRGGRVSLYNPAQSLDEGIGYFEFTLPPDRLRRLRTLVNAADLPNMKDEYPPAKSYYEADWIRVTLNNGAVHKSVKVDSQPVHYPKRIKPLANNDVTDESRHENEWPSGALPDLQREALDHPLAAVRARMILPTSRLRKGRKMAVSIAVTNIGNAPVAIPSASCTAIGGGSAQVYLQHSPATYKEAVSGGAVKTEYRFGAPMQARAGSLSPQLRSDLKHMTVLAPGKSWVLKMPQPLIPPDAGARKLIWSIALHLNSDRAAISKALGTFAISGLTGDSTAVTVVK